MVKDKTPPLSFGFPSNLTELFFAIIPDHIQQVLPHVS
jgi:hypothetical protein